MATSAKLGMYLPTREDYISVKRDITDNLSILDAAAGNMDIIINGNTASVNVTSGQFVTVLNSTITGRPDGLYQAASDVAALVPFTAANLSIPTSGALNELVDRINTLNDHFAPSMTSPAYINTSIPLNAIGRQTFTGSSNDPLPDGSTSGTMLANYIRFGSGSATNQRYGTLILNNSGETYVKNRGTDNAPYGTWHKVLYEEPFVQTKSYSSTYSLSAGGAKNITGTDLGVSTPTGYTPFAVLQFSSGTNAVMPRLVNVKSTGSNSVMSLYNTGSSAVSDASASITIAYIKTSLISS